MVDYRELLGLSGLCEEALDGDGVRIAVLDDGIPTVNDIFVCFSRNFTTKSIKDKEHATFIGSLLFGNGEIIGICPKATACFGKVMADGITKADTLAEAICYVTDSWHPDIINISLGFSRSYPCPESLKKACDFAAQRGVTIVAAAGNDGGQVLWPAALPSVISVGTCDKGIKATFSNRGEIDFVAPGVDLKGLDQNGEIVIKSGTSFSSALISGILALLLAKAKRVGIKLTMELLKKELEKLCKDLGIPGWDEQTGYGTPFEYMIDQVNATLTISSTFGRVFGKIITFLKKIFKRRHNGK